MVFFWENYTGKIICPTNLAKNNIKIQTLYVKNRKTKSKRYFFYSYLNESIGSSCDALAAG